MAATRRSTGRRRRSTTSRGWRRSRHSAGFFRQSLQRKLELSDGAADARVASAELFVTNDRGTSPTCSTWLARVVEKGLRTLSGGQYTIQVEGFLAVDQSAAPALVVEAGHAVRDVYAVLGTAADAQVKVTLKVNGNPYCTLTFEPGRSVSDSAFGYQLPPLAVGSTITLAVGPVGRPARARI